MHIDSVHTALVDHLRLARTEGVGPVAWRRLLGRYGSPARALEAIPTLAKLGGRSEAPRVPSIADAHRELEGLRALGGRGCLSSASRAIRRCSRCWMTRPRFFQQSATSRSSQSARSRSWVDATPRPMASAWRRASPKSWPPLAW